MNTCAMQSVTTLFSLSTIFDVSSGDVCERLTALSPQNVDCGVAVDPTLVASLQQARAALQVEQCVAKLQCVFDRMPPTPQRVTVALAFIMRCNSQPP
jgi:hypothetical protein